MGNVDRAVENHTTWCLENFGGMRVTAPDYEPEEEIELCPGCGRSVMHPQFSQLYAPDVRRIGQPLPGWHNRCAEAEEEAMRDLAQFSDALMEGKVSA